MSTTILTSLGAIDSKNQYISVASAMKKTTYFCPDCKRQVIVVHGRILKKHFRHKPSATRENSSTIAEKSECQYFERPGESDIHKDAKLKLMSMLEKKTLRVYRHCSICNTEKLVYHHVPNHDHIVVTEYRTVYNATTIVADVAILTKTADLIAIFEICHTNKTNESKRPDP